MQLSIGSTDSGSSSELRAFSNFAKVEKSLEVGFSLVLHFSVLDNFIEYGMKRISLLVLLASSLLISVDSFAQTSATFDFIVTVNGRFNATDTLDVKPSRRCITRLFARMASEGGATLSGNRLIDIRRRRKKTFTFRSSRLRAVENFITDTDGNGEDAIVTMFTRTTCGRRSNRVTIESAPVANFVICGRGNGSDRPGRWFRRLERNLSVN